jgi:nucleotide-binding universal stress UspA family protein
MTDAVILVAEDASPFGSVVLPYAEAVARVLGCQLRLFSVLNPRVPGHSLAATELAVERQRVEHARIATYLANAAAAVSTRGLAATTVLVRGDPADEILKEAEKPEVVLVALSTRGLHGMDRLIMGSVADKIMRFGSKPTLMVRLPYIPYPERTVAVSTVLVPLDGSAVAEEALPLVSPFLRSGARIRLVRVEPWLSEGNVSYGIDPEYTELEDQVAHDAEAYLDGVREQLSPRDAVEAWVLRGSPAENLAAYALHEHIDLVAMTTHGSGGLRRLVVGSTADFLVRSGIPTLLVRPGVVREEDAG